MATTAVPITRWSHDYLQNMAIIELQEGFLSGYTPEGDFTSLVTQSGSPIDTPKVVSYGANRDSDSAIINYTNGVFTFLKTGTLAFKSRLRAGRSGAAGVATYFSG